MRFWIGAAFVLAAALPAAAQEKSPLEQDLEKAIERINSERSSDAETGRAELTAVGRKAVPALLKELAAKGKAPDAKQRQAYARVRRLVCEILGDIRDNSPEVLDALTARLKDADEFGQSVASAAANALAKIADERSAPALLKALQSKQAELDKWLKYYAIHGLGILRAKDAAEPLIKALEDKGAAEVGTGEKQHVIAAAAADALGRLRAAGAAEGLSKLLKNAEVNPYSQQQVAVHAARALEKILGVSRGALEGDASTVAASLEAWRKWWDGEETKRNLVKVRAQVAEVAAAVEKYRTDNGEYPAILDYLAKKPEGKELKNWPDGGYLKAEQLKDPWGTALVYNSRGDNGAPFDVISFGRDRRAWGAGDDADVWNHDKWGAVKLEKSKKALEAVSAALEAFKKNEDRYPDKLEDLVTKPSYAKKFPEKPYLEKLPTDGFDSRLYYVREKTKDAPFDLVSWGMDLVEGGSDLAADLWNHDKWKGPKAEQSRKIVDETGKAIDKFRADQGRLPERLEDLRNRPTWAKTWEKPYVSDDGRDAFRNPLSYAPGADGSTFTLKSLGADGKEGGADGDADLEYKKK